MNSKLVVEDGLPKTFAYLKYHLKTQLDVTLQEKLRVVSQMLKKMSWGWACSVLQQPPL